MLNDAVHESADRRGAAAIRVPRTQAGTVLIAEGDAVVREMLADLVWRESGLTLAGACGDAEAAVELAHRHRPEVAVVDVKIPKGGGPRAAAGILRHSPETKILALTAYEDRTSVLEMLGAGAAGYLMRGTPGPDAVTAIRRTVLGESVLDGQTAAAVVGELSDRVRSERHDAERAGARRARVETVLSGGGIFMAHQPIVDLRTGRVAGVEALARLDTDPLVGPGPWFAEARAAGLGVEAEMAAVRVALADLDRLPPSLYLSVNISPEIVLSPTLAGALRFVPAERVVLEITEHALIDDYGEVARALDGFRARGGRVAVDDAGAGYASMRHIVSLTPDIVKMDVFLTRGVDGNGTSRALVACLARFTSDIGATLVAEGIETAEGLHALRELGVTHGQGYLLGRPGALSDVLAAATEASLSA